MSELSCTISKQGAVTIVKLGGSLDAATCSGFRKKLTKLLDEKVTGVVINMLDVQYIASAGLGVLISFNEDMEKNGGKVKLSALNEKVKKIFKLLGFINLFEIYENEKKAVDSF